MCLEPVVFVLFPDVFLFDNFGQHTESTSYSSISMKRFSMLEKRVKRNRGIAQLPQEERRACLGHGGTSCNRQ